MAMFFSNVRSVIVCSSDHAVLGCLFVGAFFVGGRLRLRNVQRDVATCMRYRVLDIRSA